MKTQMIKLVGGFCSAAVLITSFNASAVDPDNKVVLHYKTVSLGYGYTPDYADTSVDLHEAMLSLSYDVSNILLGVDVANGWFDEGDLNVFTVRPNVGYIVPLNNRLHIIPQVGGQYFRFHDWDYYYADGWNLDATARVNLAVTERIQIGVYGGYIWNLEADLFGEDISDLADDTWTVGGDVRFAITDNFGLVPFVSYQPDWENFKVGFSLTFGF